MYIYKLYVSFSDQTYVTVIIGPGGRWSAGIRAARGLEEKIPIEDFYIKCLEATRGGV